MVRVGLSIGLRVLINVEALNMAETVGNVNRHRRAPVVFADSKGGGYTIAFVPVISGMSLAHHYMRVLTKIASSMGLPVTKMDVLGYYPKFSDGNIIKNYYQDAKNVQKVITGKKGVHPCDVEKAILADSVVADVTGFLYTDATTKRTSRIRFSYLVPAVDALEAGAASTQPQLHVRYMPKPQDQAMLDVEQASALYTMMTTLDLTGVGEYSNCDPGSALPAGERVRRAEAAVKALVNMLVNMDFGAKRSRYEPHWSVKSLVATVSVGPTLFTVTPPHSKAYLRETVERASVKSRLIGGYRFKVYYYDGEGLEELGTVKDVTVRKAGSFGEALELAASEAIAELRKELGA
ncbi:MAG: DevR family CRISPR-associated autoregulator [Desulfurococcales archaeon]|nr:DevR family CRISPR-associated autoregulator [Desulfurococcales archaeon]